MKKTVRQALIDEIAYPLSIGFVDNKLFVRGLDPDKYIATGDDVAEGTLSVDILSSKAFIGATADCLFSLIESPSISEAGKSVSLGDKNLILSKVNALYNSIGESSKTISGPSVHFGRLK